MQPSGGGGLAKWSTVVRDARGVAAGYRVVSFGRAGEPDSERYCLANRSNRVEQSTLSPFRVGRTAVLSIPRAQTGPLEAGDWYGWCHAPRRPQARKVPELRISSVRSHMIVIDELNVLVVPVDHYNRRPWSAPLALVAARRLVGRSAAGHQTGQQAGAGDSTVAYI